MAKRKEGHEVLFVEVPIELKDRLRAVAKVNKRSMVAQAVVAIERNVAEEEAARAAEEPAAQKAKAKKGGGR